MLGKDRSLLHGVIRDEPELSALGEDGGFILERAVFEPIGETNGNLAASHPLGEITYGDELSVERAHDEKTVRQTFFVTYGNIRCGHLRYQQNANKRQRIGDPDDQRFRLHSEAPVSMQKAKFGLGHLGGGAGVREIFAAS